MSVYYAEINKQSVGRFPEKFKHCVWWLQNIDLFVWETLKTLDEDTLLDQSMEITHFTFNYI